MHVALNFRRVDPDRGGAETYVVDLCRHLVRAGHAVTLFAESWRDDALPREVARVRVPAEGATRMARVWNFAGASEAALRDAAGRFDASLGFINTWHHDVIIPQGGVQPGSLEANARRFAPGWKRAAYRLGKRANPKFWMYREIERRQYDPARGARVVAVSGMVRGHLERYHGVPPDRIRVIPNAIDAGRLVMDDPAAARAAFRSEHRLRPDDLVALFVGHNYALKGLGPLLDALALRRRRDPSARPIRLLACGGGRPARFRAMVDRLGLSDHVRMLGFQDDIRPAFHAADFFALPSYYDPCSLVVFEALSCGLPVITTACNGAGELITPGREGFVVTAPDSHAHLADALDRMADDSARAGMSAHAARLGLEQSFERHVERLVGVLEEAADAKRRRTPHRRQPSTRHGGRGASRPVLLKSRWN